MIRWKTTDGVCRLQKVPGGTISMTGCFGSQMFANPLKKGLEDFCRDCLKRGVAHIKNIAQEHKTERVVKEDLHASFEDLRRDGDLDLYSWKRLLHMTRSCNCTPERMYYRLKNFFGEAQAHLVDKIKITGASPDLDKTVNGFYSLCKALEKQNFTVRQIEVQ